MFDIIEKKPKTLVIIVTYNGMKWLERCLNSVVNSSIPLDCYIIDNGSTDGSQEYITKNFSQFIFYQSPTNSGFGAANNIGLKHAIENEYDYVYLLNQDAWVEQNTIEILIKQQQLHPEYGVLSPLQTNAGKTKLDKNFETCAAKANNLLSDSMFNTLKEIYNVNFVMAAHWLISKECLQTVGLFSPIFYHYGEDDNYIHRANYFKYKVGIIPSAIGIHDREFRETTQKKEIYLLSVFFLICSANINHSYLLSILKAFYIVIKESIKKAIIYRKVSIIFTIIPKLFRLKSIFNDRQKNKKPHEFQSNK